ncbi:hypothetical protein WN944_018550 [Citrus x changshan-huyou]|uniref:Protein kinase domain-containing protein n=1 Tax=Citrus x changshan-huyou TaxID=2935761 RepID=A0AAP0QFJ5_9ROSI
MGLISLSIGLDLSRSQLSGSYPTEVGNLKNLELLNISRNMLQGEILSTLGSCIRLEQLEMQDEFTLANQISVGSFGYVYKGILDEGRMIVAVKVCNFHHRASKGFIIVCNALKSIRHRNLVKVLTACSGVVYHDNDFKVLVYELIHNGSLEDWLYLVTKEDKINEAPRSFNLLHRLSITIDVVCALKYLHHDCQPPIAHCNLKPSNVLLDDEMTAHVGDFGLARAIVQLIKYFIKQKKARYDQLTLDKEDDNATAPLPIADVHPKTSNGHNSAGGHIPLSELDGDPPNPKGLAANMDMEDDANDSDYVASSEDGADSSEDVDYGLADHATKMKKSIDEVGHHYHYQWAEKMKNILHKNDHLYYSECSEPLDDFFVRLHERMPAHFQVSQELERSDVV